MSRSLPSGVYLTEKNETAEKLIALAEILELDGDCLFNGVSGNSYGKFLRVLAKELTEVKPAEWSHEDEIGWTNTMIMIKETASNHYTKDSIKLVIDWLITIKQRQIWKPSEEQISALDFAIDCTVYPEFQDKIKVLIELLEQLKQL